MSEIFQVISRLRLHLISYLDLESTSGLSWQANFWHIMYQLFIIYVSGISQAFRRLVSGIYQAYLSLISTHTYLRFISDTSQPYLKNILEISQRYILDVVGISLAALRHISCISQVLFRHIGQLGPNLSWGFRPKGNTKLTLEATTTNTH